MRKYKFFPGCLARVKLPHIEKSVRKVLATIGIELVDVDEFTCCPDPVVFRSASRRDWLILAARNLALNSENPILTLCPGCASSMAEASFVLESEPDVADEVREILRQSDYEMRISEVSHFLKVLVSGDVLSTLKSMLRRDMGDLRVAVHYGCHLVRPSVAVDFDDPERPESLEKVVAATGARIVDYEDKMLCCGRPSIAQEASRAILEHKLRCLKEAGSDLLVVACPFCFEQFDLGQMLLTRERGKEYNIPVLYVTQLIGLAMGMKDEMGLEYHHTMSHKLL